MFYVGLSTSGLYSLLSASSADGLTWTKESGIRLQFNGGQIFLNSPRPVNVSNTQLRLFYVRDSVGNRLASDYRVYSATSSDGGLSFSEEGSVLSATAYAVKAIKRRYNLIPLTPVRELRPNLAMANSCLGNFKTKEND